MARNIIIKDDTIKALSHVIHQYQRYFGLECGAKKIAQVNDEKGYHTFIPSHGILQLFETFKHLNTIYKEKSNASYIHPRFLDAGCGIGNILMLASEAGFCTTGIEYNPAVSTIAKKLVCNSAIYTGDMTTYKKYGQYDVIFYFVPIADHNKMGKCAYKIARDMKIGAYMIPNSYHHPFVNSKSFKRMVDIKKATVYEKIAKFSKKWPWKGLRY